VTAKESIELKTSRELELMRKAGQVAGAALNEVARFIVPGVTTKELDRIAEKFIRKIGAVPTFLGYRGYPASICTSINEEVVHGIPGNRKLKIGEIISIDLGATVDGFVGDTAATFAVGDISKKAQELLFYTKKSLEETIKLMVPGNRLGDIGACVQAVVEPRGFGVVREFVGHGIGRQMHEAPAVPNYGTAGTGVRFEPGLVLAIEPMVTAGDYAVQVLKDGWTVVTKDGSLAAHFEHTIAVTEAGPVVLTEVSD
jgi:methionyl aminopeptidase